MRIPRFRIVKRPAPSTPLMLGAPIIAILLAFGICSIPIIISGVNPLVAYYRLFSGAWGNPFNISETLTRLAPLLLTGTAVALAFTCKYWNIGAEGQLYAGGVVATFFGISFLGAPSWLIIPLIIAGSFLGGLLWGCLPAILKAKFKVDEVVTTLLGNFIMLYLVSTLIRGPWKDPTAGWHQSPPIVEAARFPKLVPGPYRVHLGLLVAVAFLVLFHVVIKKTAWGYELKCVGAGPDAAHAMGINVSRSIVTAAILSGGMAGLAGAGEVCAIQYRLIEELSPGYGYSGIVIAMLGRLSPIGVALAALLLATIITGAEEMHRATGVPWALRDVIQGMMLLCLLISLFFAEYRIQRIRE